MQALIRSMMIKNNKKSLSTISSVWLTELALMFKMVAMASMKKLIAQYGTKTIATPLTKHSKWMKSKIGTSS